MGATWSKPGRTHPRKNDIQTNPLKSKERLRDWAGKMTSNVQQIKTILMQIPCSWNLMDLRNFECNKLKYEFWQDWNARKHHDKNTKHPFDWSQTSGAQPGCLVQKLRCLGCFTNRHTKNKPKQVLQLETLFPQESAWRIIATSLNFKASIQDFSFPQANPNQNPGPAENSRKAVKRAQPQWTVGYWTLKLSSFPGWCLKILFSLASELHCL